VSVLPPVLYQAPLTDPRTGLISRPWAQWFAALEERVGGAVAPTNAELVTQVTQVTTVQATQVTQVTQLTAQTAALVEALQAILVELRRARLGLSILTETDLQAESLQEESVP
jgi:hypothetical protein